MIKSRGGKGIFLFKRLRIFRFSEKDHLRNLEYVLFVAITDDLWSSVYIAVN